ncbi:MAG: YdcF family protein [Oscillospiraceae bacterium]|nr:YdcF family protein [Oscillospiraceae bacterium]
MKRPEGRKTAKKALGIIALILCVLIIAAVSLDLLVVISSNKHIAKTAPDSFEADCILVLGCGVRPDGDPSAMLKDRLDKAIELYFDGAAPKIIMSGDHGRTNYDEVNTMKDYAIAAGVPSENVFMDHAGFSTYESMYRARDIFEVQSLIIVSQKYHLPRAVYIARALGLDAKGVPAEDIAYYGQTLRWAREVAARVKDVFWCIFKPEPTFLGETIPVWSSGDLTNDK